MIDSNRLVFDYNIGSYVASGRKMLSLNWSHLIYVVDSDIWVSYLIYSCQIVLSHLVCGLQSTELITLLEHFYHLLLLTYKNNITQIL